MSEKPVAPFGEHLQGRSERGRERRRRVQVELGDAQDGVATLRQIVDLGVTYDEVRAEIEAGRWHQVGRKTISVSGPTPINLGAVQRRAIWDVGGGACLDGVSSLQAWGLTKWDDDQVHVSVPQGARYHRVPGVRVHVFRERGPVVEAGIPRTPSEVAALRAAGWARTDRAAMALLALGLDPEPLLDQVEAALRKGGWHGPQGDSRQAG